MSVKYTKSGDNWFMAPDAVIPAFIDMLPVGNYHLRLHPLMGYHFTEAKPFTLGKVYGDVHKRVRRILDTYVSRQRNTGVLAVGEKGSGKTMMTQLLAIEAAENYNIPTIIIDGNPCGEAFNNFLGKIDYRALVLFDEFEKSYNAEQQASLLTIFDGVYQSNKLFMFTANDEFKIDRSMISRPGRIFYRFDYKFVDDIFINEYCEDILENRSRITEVLRIANAYGGFTFDKLKALVEEMNRYDEPAVDAIKYLNVEFSDFRSSKRYDMEVFLGKERVYQEDYAVSINPFVNSMWVQIEANEDEDDEQTTQHTPKKVRLTPDKIHSVTNNQQRITYKIDGYTIVLIEPLARKYDYKKDAGKHEYEYEYDR